MNPTLQVILNILSIIGLLYMNSIIYMAARQITYKIKYKKWRRSIQELEAEHANNLLIYNSTSLEKKCNLLQEENKNLKEEQRKILNKLISSN